MAELHKLAAASGIDGQLAMQLGRSATRALRGTQVKVDQSTFLAENSRFQVLQQTLGVSPDVAKMMGEKGMEMSLTSSTFG